MSESRLRIVFMGTPRFAVKTLSALIARGHEAVGVYTRPDRRAGRGRQTSPPPVKAFAEKRGVPVFQPESLTPDAVSQLAALAPDAIVVAAYGVFLPKAALELPRLGCVNIHPSLLPKHRGAAPVAASILEGEQIAGVSVMLIDEGMDTGPILAQRRTAILPSERADALTDRLFDIGSALLVDALDDWSAGRIAPRPQDESLATVTRRLTREDGRVDWTESAAALALKLRAFHPWPGMFTAWRGRHLKIWDARAADAQGAAGGEPGTVFRINGGGVAATAGEGALELLEMQLEGGKRVSAADFSRGRDFIGSRLGEWGGVSC